MFGKLVCHVDLFFGGGLHRSHVVGCSKYPTILSEACSPMLSEAQTCGVKMSCSDMTIAKDECNGQVCSAFPSACGDTLCEISVVDLKLDARARLADDFAKALLEVPDTKEFTPAQARVATTLLGTTARWKRAHRAKSLGTPSVGYTAVLWQSRLVCSRRSGLQQFWHFRFQDGCFVFGCVMMTSNLRRWKRREDLSKPTAVWHTGSHSSYAAWTWLGRRPLELGGGPGCRFPPF